MRIADCGLRNGKHRTSNEGNRKENEESRKAGKENTTAKMKTKQTKKKSPEFQTWTETFEWVSLLDKPTTKKEIRKKMKWQKLDAATRAAARGCEIVGFETYVKQRVFTSATTTAIFKRSPAVENRNTPIPSAAFDSPRAFRLWLLKQGNYSFSGGAGELLLLRKYLPENPTLIDIRNSKCPFLSDFLSFGVNP